MSWANYPGDLTDEQWQIVKKLPPKSGARFPSSSWTRGDNKRRATNDYPIARSPTKGLSRFSRPTVVGGPWPESNMVSSGSSNRISRIPLAS